MSLSSRLTFNSLLKSRLLNWVLTTLLLLSALPFLHCLFPLFGKYILAMSDTNHHPLGSSLLLPAAQCQWAGQAETVFALEGGVQARWRTVPREECSALWQLGLSLRESSRSLEKQQLPEDNLEALAPLLQKLGPRREMVHKDGLQFLFPSVIIFGKGALQTFLS